MASSFKEQYVDSVMMTTIKTATAMLIFVGLAAFSSNALASDVVKGSQTEKESAASNSEPKASPSEHGAKQSDNAKNDAKDSDFVDKDGDGIRDGKEHRFRRRSKHGNDGDSGRHTGKQRRKKAQYGKGNGA